MPINIQNGLPAKTILENEKIFAIEDDSARKQRVRPIQMVILNLMPKKNRNGNTNFKTDQ